MAAIFPSRLIVASEPQPRLVNKRGGLKRVSGCFARHLRSCEPAQLVVNHLKQLLRCTLLTLLDRPQEFGDSFPRPNLSRFTPRGRFHFERKLASRADGANIVRCSCELPYQSSPCSSVQLR
jgi:hypothetical protein